MSKTKKLFLKILFQILLLMLFSCSLLGQEYGFAAVYSKSFEGRKTAYEYIYDSNEYIAAHKKHLFGTILKVTNLRTKQSTIVKVVDKGPYIKGRIVDLSTVAAREIGVLENDIIEVKVEVLNKDFFCEDQTNLPHKRKAIEIIEEKLNQQREFWNRGDLIGYLSFYWQSNETYYSSGEELILGWNNLKTWISKKYSTKTSMGSIDLEISNISTLDNNIVSVTGKIIIIHPNHEEVYQFSSIWKKVTKDWLIVINHIF